MGVGTEFVAVAQMKRAVSVQYFLIGALVSITATLAVLPRVGLLLSVAFTIVWVGMVATSWRRFLQLPASIVVRDLANRTALGIELVMFTMVVLVLLLSVWYPQLVFLRTFSIVAMLTAVLRVGWGWALVRVTPLPVNKPPRRTDSNGTSPDRRSSEGQQFGCEK